MRAAAAKEVVHEGALRRLLFAAVACEAAPDVLPDKPRYVDANAAAYAAHLASPFCGSVGGPATRWSLRRDARPVRRRLLRHTRPPGRLGLPQARAPRA